MTPTYLPTEIATRIRAEVESFHEEYDLLPSRPNRVWVTEALGRITQADPLTLSDVAKSVGTLVSVARENRSPSETFLLEDFASVLAHLISPAGGAR